MDFSFLTSTRFYYLILGAVGAVLVDPETLTRPWFVSVGRGCIILSAGFIGIKTLDRTVDKLSSSTEANTAIQVDTANVQVASKRKK